MAKCGNGVHARYGGGCGQRSVRHSEQTAKGGVGVTRGADRQFVGERMAQSTDNNLSASPCREPQDARSN